VRQEAAGVKVVVSAGTAVVVDVVIVDGDAMMLI
jgi:pantothenate kinase type III